MNVTVKIHVINLSISICKSSFTQATNTNFLSVYVSMRQANNVVNAILTNGHLLSKNLRMAW